MSVCRGHSLPTSASLYQCDSDEVEAERMAEDQMEVHPKQVGIVGRGAIQTTVQMADISFCWAVLLGHFAQLSRIVPGGTEETRRQEDHVDSAAS